MTKGIMHRPLPTEVSYDKHEAHQSSDGLRNNREERRRTKRCQYIDMNEKSLETELLLWLRGRSHWDHKDWQELISMLECKGYQCPVGPVQDSIGQFLEDHRSV